MVYAGKNHAFNCAKTGGLCELVQVDLETLFNRRDTEINLILV